MYLHRRKPYLSQNFLNSRTLVYKLVRQSSIGQNDTVLEIGPGKGIITRELIKFARQVTAVEQDHNLYHLLKKKYSLVKNFKLYYGDFLRFPLPGKKYKVFANIPFAIEGKIIRKLLNAPNPPEDCYITMRKDLAYRLSGIYKKGQFNISYKPWFDFDIFHHFRRADFKPKPKVQAVILRVIKRPLPFLSIKERQKYSIFIKQGFRTTRRPSRLSLNHWLKIYQQQKLFF